MHRIALFRVWTILLVLGAGCTCGVLQVNAQTIDLRMGLAFANPADDQSGGTFQLAALSNGGGGISALAVYLEDVDLSLMAPTTPELFSPATYNWLEVIQTSGGDVLPIQDRGAGVTEILLGQDVSLPIGDLVFGIGHGAGSPGDQGADPFGLGFDNAALLATGTFSPGSIPSFSGDSDFGTAGNLFEAVDSRAVMSNPDRSNPVVVNLSVVDNLGVGPGIVGDYNTSGQVEQGDLDLVLLNWGDDVPPVPTGWSNDLPTEPKIDQDDLDRVLLNWGKTASAVSVTAVPEPSSLWIIAMGMTACLIRRSRRVG